MYKGEAVTDKSMPTSHVSSLWNSPSAVVYSILQHPDVISGASRMNLSIKKLKRSGESTQPCLTPLSILNPTENYAVVQICHHMLVYISLMMSTR